MRELGVKMNKLKSRPKTQFAEHDRILPVAAHAHAKKLASDPQTAFEFLVRCGIYQRDGKLHRNYRP